MSAVDRESPPAGDIPRHVAIIMDGNGRWAQQRLLPRHMGHREGVKAVRRVVGACRDFGVEVLTLFAFSSENWRRPASEVSQLMELFLTTLRSEINRLRENNVRLRFIGDPSGLSPKLQHHIAEAERITADNDEVTLVVAVNYGGRWDILQASRRMLREAMEGRLSPDDIRLADLERHIALHDLPEPDLFIRTGGERRISNFLLWQLAYTELYFTDALWPDYDANALREAIDWFGRRQRRFGMTGEQIEQHEDA